MTLQDEDTDLQTSYDLPAFMLPGYRCPLEQRRKPMPDGTLFVGLSPSGYAEMFTTATNLSYYADCWLFTPIKSDHVMELVKQCISDGHRDWRLPSLAEMGMLFENREAIYFKSGWYWVLGTDATQPKGAMHFPDGTYEPDHTKVEEGFVRCIRYQPLYD